MKKLLFAVLFASSLTAYAIQPQAEADNLMIEAQKLMDAGRHSEAVIKFQRIEALKVKVPETFAYHYGVALANMCDPIGLKKSKQLLDQFISQTGSNGKFFKEAVEQTVRLETRPAECLALAEIEKITPKMVIVPGRNYEIGKYEVTQAQWEALIGNNPSDFKGANLPVEHVSWNEVQNYINKLNQKTGKQYRLPTEEEWQYACYGGVRTEFCGSNDIDEVAWYYDNSNNQTHPGGQKKANGYGIYDMSGNVWEWTESCFEGDCSRRIIRGGSATPESRLVRASSRYSDLTSNRAVSRGFRLERTLP